MLTISILLAALYVGAAIWNRKELPESVSAMVYVLPRSGQWAWIVWMWAVALLTCIPLIDALPDGARMLGFLTLACLVFCGAMPISNNTTNRRAHNAFGILSGVFSQVCVAVVSPWWLAAWSLLVLAWIWTTKDFARKAFDGKGVFLAEMICAVAVFGSLLTRLAAMS